MKAQLIQAAPRSGRVMREPSHTFHVRHKPFVIQPFAIAAVLPGETMKNALLQARVLGPRVKNDMMGAWCEHYLFYVKLRDLASWLGASGYRSMLMDASVNVPGAGAASAPLYTYAGGINYVQEALTAIVDEFFRDEGTTAANFQLDGLPLAQINHASYLDSAITNASIGTPGPGDYLPGQKPENEDASLTPEFDPHYAAWFKMFSNGYTTLDYDDYLRQYGIKTPEIEREEETSKPELLRYMRDWTYPANTVDATGQVSSLWSWSVQERADKARLFKEPGFIVGLTCVRPKVYLSKMGGAGVGMLGNALQWLPKALETAEFTALKQFAAGAGPVLGQTDGYWVDVRDLLLHGDQMLNVPLTTTDAGLVALPTPTMQKRYVSQADIDGLTVTANAVCRQDGVLKLTIAGTVREVTPGH